MPCLCCNTYSKVSSKVQDDPGEEIETHQPRKTEVSNLLLFLLFLLFIIPIPAFVIYFSGILKSSTPVAVKEVSEMMVAFGPVSGCRRGFPPKDNKKCFHAFSMELLSDPDLSFWGETTGGIELDEAPYGCVYSEASHVIFFNLLVTEKTILKEHKFNSVCIITEKTEIESETYHSIEVIDPRQPTKMIRPQETPMISEHSTEDSHCSDTRTLMNAKNSPEVILLVSFEHSGDTLLRHYIEKMSGIYTATANENEAIGDKTKKCLQADIPSNGRAVVVNSHYPTLPNDKFLGKKNVNGMILLQRNPFAVFQEAYSDMVANTTASYMRLEEYQKLRRGWSGIARELTSKYVRMYLNYRSKPGFGPILHVFYEDLIKDPVQEMVRIEGFLKERKTNFNSRPEWRSCLLEKRENDCKPRENDARWEYGLALKDYICDSMVSKDLWFRDIWGECHLTY